MSDYSEFTKRIMVGMEREVFYQGTIRRARANGQRGPIRQAKEVAGEVIGMSGTTYARCRDVVVAALGHPDKYGDLLDRLERGDPPAMIHRVLKTRQAGGAEVHKLSKAHRVDGEDSMNRICSTLDGVCMMFPSIDPASLPSYKIHEWGEKLADVSLKLLQLRKEINGHEENV